MRTLRGSVCHASRRDVYVQIRQQRFKRPRVRLSRASEEELLGQPLDGSVDSRAFHYCQMPKHFTYKDGWKERMQGAKTIGRMYFVAPSNSKTFALRLLLFYGRGFTLFVSMHPSAPHHLAPTRDLSHLLVSSTAHREIQGRKLYIGGRRLSGSRSSRRSRVTLLPLAEGR